MMAYFHCTRRNMRLCLVVPSYAVGFAYMCVCRIRLFAHYTTPLLSSCRPIWRYWTANRYSVMNVSKIRSVLSTIIHVIYGAVCIRLNNFSYDDCENTCTWSYHHQIGSMIHLPLFRVRSWSNGMHSMSCYILKLNKMHLQFAKLQPIRQCLK